MPFAVPIGMAVAATIKAGSDIYSAHKQGDAQQKALDYAQQQEADRKKAWEQQYSDYKANVESWNSLRRSLAAHLGVTLPEGSGAPMGGGAASPLMSAPAQLASAPPEASLSPEGPNWLPDLPGGRSGSVADLISPRRA